LRRISEINLTPLMDLTFILLITFIITFPLIEQGIPVNLPQGKAPELAPETARSITVGVKGELYLDSRPVTKDVLRTRLLELGAADASVTMMVRADEGVPYGRVVDVLKLLQEAKLTKMALVTRAP
jgi:biopolymer transport protein TolR